jgi:hypothetical protein
VYVPIYFTIGSTPLGHIAISMPDGRVASSTQEGTHQGLYIHPNLNDLIDMYAKYDQGCTYLGWSEGLANTSIVAEQGAAQDMDPIEIVRGIRRITAPDNVVSEAVIKADADRITNEGSIDGVLIDNLNSVPWRNVAGANLWAIEAYARGRDDIANPSQYAQDRFNGGDTFPDLMNRDMPGYVGATLQVATDKQILKSYEDANAGLTQQLKDAQNALHEAQQPQPAPIATDCQQQADEAVNNALERYTQNPWPLVAQWFSNHFKKRGDS